MANREQRSPWLWIGIGCGGCAVVLVLAGVAFAVFAYRWGKSIEHDVKDPQARADRALALLGTAEIPPGYYPGPSFSVPFLMDVAILVDQPLDARGEISHETRSLFVYVNLIRGGREWRDYVEGRSKPEDLLGQSGLRLDGGATIGSGEMKVGTLDVAWVARRGGGISLRESRPLQGLTTLMFLKCPEDRRMRVGVWLTPDPAPAAATPEVDLTGTAADPAAIEALLSRFRLCAG